MKIDFDPNNRKPPAIEWSTYIPNREPQFKLHKRKSDALNAFTYRNTAILYQYDFEKNEWAEVYRIEDRVKPENCDVCDATTKIVRESGGGRTYTYDSGNFAWVKGANPPRQVWMCRSCYRNR